MGYFPLDPLDRVTRNRYEAVIVAAQHARRLNAQRLAKLRQLEEEAPTFDIDGRKMTAVALRELMEGKVKVKRADTE